MPTPLEFLQQYRHVTVPYTQDTGEVCLDTDAIVQIRKYFMMDWDAGTEELGDYSHVTRGDRRDEWFRDNREAIKSAAMGKGSPGDYALALEWAVRSGKIDNPAPQTIQEFADERLGIDCSGFVTNYLVANRRKPNDERTKRNTGAASYYAPRRAVNDPLQVTRGDLLVWMVGNNVRRNPGHVAVVESYRAQSVAGGNMRVVEATGAAGANPKLLDSMYSVEQIINQGGRVPVMILVVRRHGVSGSRVSVMRW
jgi:hypothetical protein